MTDSVYGLSMHHPKMYLETTLQITQNQPATNVKTTTSSLHISLEMLDKIEAPQIPDGYGISIAYACLLDIIRSIALAITGPRDDSNSNSSSSAERRYEPTEAQRKLHAQLISSSWCGLLAALSPLVDASTDESATENVLKEIQTFASLCGLLELQTPRDAFITAICKASLPPHYALTVLYSAPQGVPSAAARQQQERQQQQQGDRQEPSTVGGTSGTQYNPSLGESDYRQQVVAVGTPLPTASLPIGECT